MVAYIEAIVGYYETFEVEIWGKPYIEDFKRIYEGEKIDFSYFDNVSNENKDVDTEEVVVEDDTYW